MKVLNIGTSEMEIIKEALDNRIKEEMELGEMSDYDFAHLRPGNCYRIKDYRSYVKGVYHTFGIDLV